MPNTWKCSPKLVVKFVAITGSLSLIFEQKIISSYMSCKRSWYAVLTAYTQATRIHRIISTCNWEGFTKRAIQNMEKIHSAFETKCGIWYRVEANFWHIVPNKTRHKYLRLTTCFIGWWDDGWKSRANQDWAMLRPIQGLNFPPNWSILCSQLLLDMCIFHTHANDDASNIWRFCGYYQTWSRILEAHIQFGGFSAWHPSAFNQTSSCLLIGKTTRWELPNILILELS